MHTYKDLGSIKSSTNKTSESIKSEFTCCSISFARALVIGPILISLGLFTIGSSVYVGGVTVVGMSSSLLVCFPCRYLTLAPEAAEDAFVEISDTEPEDSVGAAMTTFRGKVE